MDTVDPIRFIAGFAFVLGLIALSAYGLKRWQAKGGIPSWLAMGQVGGAGRIQIVEQRQVSLKWRVVLVKIDAREHALLLSDTQAIVLEQKDVA